MGDLAETIGKYVLAVCTLAGGLGLVLVGALVHVDVLIPIGAGLIGVGVGSRVPSMPGNRF